MSFAKLYDMSQEGMIISDMLTDNEGELTPDIEARLDALLLVGPERLEAAAMVVKQLESSATACEDEAKRLRDRSKGFQDNADRLKKRMVIALDCAFNGKIKTPLFTIWNQNSPATTVCDLTPGFTPEALHSTNPELVLVKYALDRIEAVRKFKNGETLPDEIFFVQNDSTRYLRIK